MQSLFSKPANFKNRTVSVKKTVYILAQNSINVDEDEATVILDFLYLIAKSSKQIEAKPAGINLTGNRTAKKFANAIF